MKGTMNKFILTSVAVIFIGGIVNAEIPTSPQIITLTHGTKFTLLGVTTGTQQKAPGYPNMANSLYTPN